MLTGLSGVTIWRRMKAGDFPLSLQLTPNKIGWFLDEVEAWMESRPRGISQLPANLK
jgi:prophage regulatory protein